MANVSALIGTTGTFAGDYQDTVTEVYRVQYDSIPTNSYAALIAAQTATGTPVPQRRTQYLGTALSRIYAFSIGGQAESIDDHRAVWQWRVTYSSPPAGQEDPDQQNVNPLLRPPAFNVRYFERERVIDEAKNLELLEFGDGKGGERPANTLGPIRNAAGKRPDEPLVDTERLEVLVIEKNFSTLAAIVARNREYKRTTNSDTAQGYGPRELRYMMTESQGSRFENGIEFWPGVTEILCEETTDLILDNVGYEVWDRNTDKFVRLKDGDGEFLAEPTNLKLDGSPGGDITTTITYRYLEAVPYAPLFV